MGTVTNYTDNVPQHGLLGGYSGYIAKKIDMSKYALSAQDVVQCVNVDAGMLVTAVSVLIGTAAGGTLTATIGDADGANSWDASVNLNDTAGKVTRSAPGTDAYATTGKVYAVADTIDLTLSNNTPGVVGVFYVIVEYVKVY
jgi:hypothetical protein